MFEIIGEKDNHGFGERVQIGSEKYKKTFIAVEKKVEEIEDPYVTARKKSYAEAKARNKPGLIDMDSLLK